MNIRYISLLITSALLVRLYSANAQCPDTLACPATSTFFICDAGDNDPGLWKSPLFFNAVFNITDLHEASVDLSIKLSDSCRDVRVTGYELWLDVNGDSIQETVVTPRNLLPGGRIVINNAKRPDFMGGDTVRFDARALKPGFEFRFEQQNTYRNDSLIARLGFNNPGQPLNQAKIPTGEHKMVWYLTRGEQMIVCTQRYLVRECVPPKINCRDTLIRTLPNRPDPTVTLRIRDVMNTVSDNLSPTARIRTAIRIVGDGTGFPRNSVLQPQDSVVLDCNHRDSVLVEVWALDLAENADSCRTWVHLRDISRQCPVRRTIFDLCAKTETGQNMYPVFYQIPASVTTGKPAISLGKSDTTGCLRIDLTKPPVSLGASYRPLRTDNPTNGLTSFDLAQISRHILGIEVLPTIYKLIAADINESGSITTFDIVQGRRLILGLDTTFPSGESWRFVRKNQIFPSLNNPFNVALASEVRPEDLWIAEDGAFIGIKTGDINNSAIPNAQAGAVPRSSTYLALPDADLAAGQTLEVAIAPVDAARWYSFQFALQYDPAQMVVESVQPGQLAALGADNFARPRPGLLTASWFNAEAQPVAAEQPLVHLRIRALTPLNLRTALRAAPQQMPAEAANETGTPQQIDFLYRTPVAKPGDWTVYAPYPNPTGAGLRIPVQVPEAAAVRLQIVDALGRQTYLTTLQLTTGLQWLETPADALPVPGVYRWRLEAPGLRHSGAVVKQ
jgi:hypothetical protein